MHKAYQRVLWSLKREVNKQPCAPRFVMVEPWRISVYIHSISHQKSPCCQSREVSVLVELNQSLTKDVSIHWKVIAQFVYNCHNVLCMSMCLTHVVLAIEVSLLLSVCLELWQVVKPYIHVSYRPCILYILNHGWNCLTHCCWDDLIFHQHR